LDAVPRHIRAALPFAERVFAEDFVFLASLWLDN
jgi:hypothetical protein